MENPFFTPMEKQMLEYLLSGEDPVLKILMQQFQSSIMKCREFTGHGYYLHFDIPKRKVEKHLLINCKTTFCFGDVEVLLNSGENKIEISYLLWVENGLINQLEIYTYGDDNWPDIIDGFSLKYIDEPRDMDSLKSNWQI